MKNPGNESIWQKIPLGTTRRDAEKTQLGEEELKRKQLRLTAETLGKFLREQTAKEGRGKVPWGGFAIATHCPLTMKGTLPPGHHLKPVEQAALDCYHLSEGLVPNHVPDAYTAKEGQAALEEIKGMRPRASLGGERVLPAPRSLAVGSPLQDLSDKISSQESALHQRMRMVLMSQIATPVVIGPDGEVKKAGIPYCAHCHRAVFTEFQGLPIPEPVCLNELCSVGRRNLADYVVSGSTAPELEAPGGEEGIRG